MYCYFSISPTIIKRWNIFKVLIQIWGMLRDGMLKKKRDGMLKVSYKIFFAE